MHRTRFVVLHDRVLSLDLVVKFVVLWKANSDEEFCAFHVIDGVNSLIWSDCEEGGRLVDWEDPLLLPW